MIKAIWLGLVYLSAFVMAIDLVVDLPPGVFAAGFAFLVATVYERWLWRTPPDRHRIFYEAGSRETENQQFLNGLDAG